MVILFKHHEPLYVFAKWHTENLLHNVTITCTIVSILVCVWFTLKFKKITSYKFKRVVVNIENIIVSELFYQSKGCCWWWWWCWLLLSLCWLLLTWWLLFCGCWLGPVAAFHVNPSWFKLWFACEFCHWLLLVAWLLLGAWLFPVWPAHVVSPWLKLLCCGCVFCHWLLLLVDCCWLFPAWAFHVPSPWLKLWLAWTFCHWLLLFDVDHLFCSCGNWFTPPPISPALLKELCCGTPLWKLLRFFARTPPVYPFSSGTPQKLKGSGFPITSQNKMAPNPGSRLHVHFLNPS